MSSSCFRRTPAATRQIRRATPGPLPIWRARAALEAERAKGLAAYRTAVLDGTYPDAATSVAMKPGEHEKLREALDMRRPFHS